MKIVLNNKTTLLLFFVSVETENEHLSDHDQC